MKKVKVNGAYEIVLPEHRAERPEWYTAKGWEKKRLRRLRQTIQDQKNPVVYYVGAEEGEMCALCSMWGAKVLMFEPNDKVMPNIKAIWEANNLPLSDLFFPGFAGNELSGDQAFTQVADIKGEVISDHGFKELQANEITHLPVTTIDSVAERYEPPTVITMDVEGAEFEVLKGSEQTLLKHKPVIVLSLHPEFLREFWGVYSRDVRNWIIDRGYEEELIEYEHEVHLIYEPKK
jgi:FkbM family methyltransferase